MNGLRKNGEDFVERDEYSQRSQGVDRTPNHFLGTRCFRGLEDRSRHVRIGEAVDARESTWAKALLNPYSETNQHVKALFRSPNNLFPIHVSPHIT